MCIQMVIKQLINPYGALDSVCMVWCVHSVVCRPTTVQLIDLSWPLPPPTTTTNPLLVWSRRNGITEQRLCWQRLKQHWAQGWPFPFHLPPTSPKPGNTGRKQGRPDESVCQHVEGIESGFRVRRKKRTEEEEFSKGRNSGECWHLCEDIERKTFSQFKSMLNESGLSSSWPAALTVPRESSTNCSRFCSRFNRRTAIIETVGWFHSHWSCYYTDDCKNEAGKQRSGFDIQATTFPLWFISTSQTVMGKATLSVFFWVVLSVCVSATGPLFSFSPFPSNFVPDFFIFYQKRRLACHINLSASRQMFIASDTPYTTLAASAVLNAFGFQTFDSIACSVCIWCTAL